MDPDTVGTFEVISFDVKVRIEIHFLIVVQQIMDNIQNVQLG